jgi:CRP-like cAMP-binding protein
MGACAAILGGSSKSELDDAKKKARESFKKSNESWVYEQTQKKKDLLQNLNKSPSASKVGFSSIPEDEETSLSDMNEMRLRLGEEDALEQHDHELLGESEELCIEDKKWTMPHNKITKSPDEIDVIQKCLSTHFLFSTLSQRAIDLCIDEMERETLQKGTTVFEEEHNDKFYIILSGKVKAVRPDGKEEFIPNESGERGFGDIALMVDIPANAVNKITVAETASVFTLHRLQFHRIAIEETRRETQRLLSILGRVDLFKRKLTDEQMEDLADHLITVKFKDGDTIVKEGTVGKNFYIVEEGQVNVHKGKEMEPIATLAHDSFFGDQSLLADKPRTSHFT